MSLAVICSHFNSQHFHSPRRNLLRFLRQCESRKIPVYIAELTYDEEPFFLPSGQNVFQFRIDQKNTMWHKENLLNLVAAHVPSGYDALAWIDPDLFFMSDDWVERAEEALGRYAVVQLFSEAFWTDEDGRYSKSSKSTMFEGSLKPGKNHPGFAWAARRGLWSSAGGLVERAIVGGGDMLFAGASLDNEIPDWMHYPEWKNWSRPVRGWIQQNGGAGFIPGTVVHEWHGDAQDRSLILRHLLLNGRNIDTLVEKREDGLLQFSDCVPDDLRRAIRSYFMRRREDGRTTEL